jgi:hypothetical protein
MKILTLLIHTRLDPSGFASKVLYGFLYSPVCAVAHAYCIM